MNLYRAAASFIPAGGTTVEERTKFLTISWIYNNHQLHHKGPPTICHPKLIRLRLQHRLQVRNPPDIRAPIKGQVASTHITTLPLAGHLTLNLQYPFLTSPSASWTADKESAWSAGLRSSPSCGSTLDWWFLPLLPSLQNGSECRYVWSSCSDPSSFRLTLNTQRHPTVFFPGGRGTSSHAWVFSQRL